MDQLTIDVQVEEDTPEEEARRVEMAFREAGLDANVHGPAIDADVEASRSSLWVVAVTVPMRIGPSGSWFTACWRLVLSA